MNIGLLLLVLTLLWWGGGFFFGWRGFVIGCSIGFVILYMLFGILVTSLSWTFINHGAGVFFGIFLLSGFCRWSARRSNQ